MKYFLILLLLFNTSCTALVVGAAAGGAGGAVTSVEASKTETHRSVTYVGTVLTNIVYFPAKIVVATGGAVLSGLGYLISGGNKEVSHNIWETTVEGDYLITPRMIEGREPVHFIGS